MIALFRSAGRSPRVLSAATGAPLWIDPEFRPAMQAAGLASFDAVMGCTAGVCLRVLPERENWRLELLTAAGRRGAFLKKHRQRTSGRRRDAAVSDGMPSAGMLEAHRAWQLRRAGIATVRPIAWGQRQRDDGCLESFVLTEELAGWLPLHDFVRNRFAPLATRPALGRDRALESLLREVAATTAALHRLGYNHRDLYCCHFFVREPSPGRFEVCLIDLERVQHRTHFRRRWLVKDLAQLAYSAPRDRIGCRDRLRFLRHYFGAPRLGRSQRRLLRAVVRKQRWMEWKLGVHP